MAKVQSKNSSSPNQEEQIYQTQRVKIANLVSRKLGMEKKCCICNKPANILHNRNGDPYCITFICNECKKDPQKLQIAETHRFNLHTELDKIKTRIEAYSEEEIKTLVEGYIKDSTLLSVQDYCKENNISRYMFNILVDKYYKMYPKSNIKSRIRYHWQQVQRHKCEKLSEARIKAI